MKTKIYILIIESDEDHDKIIKKMIEYVESSKVIIEIGSYKK